jgi:hypothetical protein
MNSASTARSTRQQVEQDEPDVHHRQLGQQADLGRSKLLDPGKIARVAEDKEQYGRDHDVDRWPCQRHQDLLSRPVRHALHPRDAADGEQRNVRRWNPEQPGRQGVPELVQEDTPEQGENECHAGNGGVCAALRVVSQTNPRQQQEERDVDLHVDARNPGNSD